MDRKNRRALPRRLERCGYVSVQNPDAKDGMWKSKGERLVIYAKAGLTPEEDSGSADFNERGSAGGQVVKVVKSISLRSRARGSSEWKSNGWAVNESENHDLHDPDHDQTTGAVRWRIYHEQQIVPHRASKSWQPHPPPRDRPRREACS